MNELQNELQKAAIELIDSISKFALLVHESLDRDYGPEEWPVDMSVRAQKALALSGLTPQQVRSMSVVDLRYELESLPNVGPTTVNEITATARRKEGKA